MRGPRAGTVPGVRSWRPSSSSTDGGKIAYRISHSQPVTSSMWKRSQCTIVTHRSTTPAMKYGAANARPRAQSRSLAHATASVVDAQ
jgi:hypothetical protein